MAEHETWLTVLFNDHLAGLGNWFLGLARQHAEDPARPWANYVTMEILVALFIIVVFALLRTRFSMDRPGKLQHTFELIYGFLAEQAEESIGHAGHKYLPYFGTVFVFILLSNLIGVIPTFESPTMFPYVTVGCAMVTLFYFIGAGIQANGLLGYFKHFVGPVWWLAPLMIPIEIISNLGRPLSLSVRLYANMYAGEQVTMVFLGLTYFVIPVIFMALHVFVSFLQAYIFTLLSMIYVNDAVAQEH